MKDFLMEFLKIYPYVPFHAFWRAIEAKILCNLSFEEPILDLGCGDGRFAKILFANKDYEIIGSDISKECVETASLCGIYISLNIADARNLPYKDNCFATVFSNCVLEHIPEVKEVLSELSRVLRRGGRLIFTVPSENFTTNLKNQDSKYIESLNKELKHFHYYSPKEWKELLGQYGFSMEYKYYIPKAVQQLWETLMQLFRRKILGRELCGLLGSKKLLGINFIVRLVFPIVFNRLLRKYYLIGGLDDEEGGALLIIARKFGDRSAFFKIA